MRRIASFIFALLIGIAAHAAIDPFEFDNESQRERYQHFIEEMRCPKCQNQNLAGSDAPIANDLRHELRRLLQEGKSDREITDYMVSRYGEFILYKPPFDTKTAVLWLAPIIFLSVGVIVLITVVRRRSAAQALPELTIDEQARLRQLLQDEQQVTLKNDNNRRAEPW
ncbi:MAG TPA: cytochrome c-type biogenesis protein [Spongiibacteraceae bacterium]|jgi:cytochrome c-type biogenesis protein CcmH